MVVSGGAQFGCRALASASDLRTTSMKGEEDRSKEPESDSVPVVAS